MSSELDVARARSHFPALKDGYIYADSAGGSQCLKEVADSITDYLLNTNVQLGMFYVAIANAIEIDNYIGADYSVSVESTNRVADGPKQTAILVNAASPDEIAFGPSSTMLVENLARAMDKDILDDEEIIITGEHECRKFQHLILMR